MARAASKPKKEISMEEALWKSADKLRGSVEPAEYKHVVLSLFFLKFASDKFEAQRKAISEKYGEKFVDNVAFYTKDNVFFLPEISRWSFIMENAKQDDIALKIDTALYTIEKANPALKGALPDNYYSRLHIDTAKLASLLDEIDKINTGDKENDIIGRIYEYFLSKFALAEGKGKGEFYTPKCIVNLIAEIIEPYDGILYDPCCGSGGMFVQSIQDASELSYSYYKALVDRIIAEKASEKEVEHLLDYMFDVCHDDRMLNLFKKVCRRYYSLYPEMIASEILAYKEWYED